MSFIFGLFTETPFLILPVNWTGWLGLLLWLGAIAALLKNWNHYNKPWTQSRWLLLLGLLAGTPLTGLLLGIRLPAWNELPPPNIALEPVGSALMLLASLPWVLAAGLLGPLPAAGLAAFSGGFLAYWDTHSVFTPLEYATLAIIFSVFVMQRYRTRSYALLRSPFFAAIVVVFLYPAIVFPGNVFITQGSLATRIDYAASLIPSMMAAAGGMVLISGMVAEIVRGVRPRIWGGQPPWLPSPAESRLSSRLIFSLVPL
ncbi:MAG TPA: hypothetical protein EYP88_03585, partial [Anaerolineales bacterium]|nr:hypothetical protein [Anaerolineales bacterium]